MCGLFWLKPVAMVLFMFCSAVLVEWLRLKPYCVEICGMLFVMYIGVVNYGRSLLDGSPCYEHYT